VKVTWENCGRRVDSQGHPIIDPRDMEWTIDEFKGANYLFMFPFPKTLRKAFLKASLKWV